MAYSLKQLVIFLDFAERLNLGAPHHFMSTPAWPLRVLLLSAAPEELSLIEETLRRNGYDATIQRVASAEDFPSVLDLAWDVSLIAPSASSDVIAQFLSLKPDLPCFSLGQIERSESSDDFRPSTMQRLGVDIARSMTQQQTRQPAEQEVALAKRKAEGALRESEERYRALVESTFDLVCELDAEGRCVYTSPNYSQRLGFVSGELLGETIFERIHPKDQDKVIAKFANLMAGKANGPMEFRHAHKNGEWVWLEGAMRAVRGSQKEDPESLRVVLIARDIGERKRHEREMAALISLAKAINAQTDLPAIAREVNANLQNLLPYDACCIAILKDDELIFIGQDDAVANAGAPATISRANDPDHPAWQAISHSAAWMVNRWTPVKAAQTKTAKESVSAIDDKTRAFIIVPLIADGQTIGVLSFTSERPYIFTDDHSRLAGMAGEQVAVAAHQVRLLEKTLRTESKYRAIVQDVDAIVWEADPQSLAFTFVNPQAQARLGFSLGEWLGDPDFWTNRIYPEDRDRVLRARQKAVAEGRDFQLDYRVLSADERILWLRDLGSVEVQNGQTSHVRGLMIDITERKQFETTLLERNTILKAVQEAAADGICVMNNDGHAISYNKRFLEMWPIPEEQLEDLRYRNQVMAWIASSLQDSNAFIEKISALSDDMSDDANAETRDDLRLKDNRLFECYSAPAMTAEGTSFGRVWSFRDVTARELFEQQLAHQAFHDPLTNLPNRSLFMDRLEHAIARSERVAKLVGVLFLDLDRFKIVNDSLGHPIGDELLVQVAARIQQSVRPTDTAARFGGDEFTVLVEDILAPGDATQVATRILEGLQAPFNLAGHEVHVSASIGIALSTSPTDNCDDLLRKADVAMYWSKNKASGGFEMFDTKMSAQALERLQLEIDLRQAVKRNQLRLCYQPLVNLASGSIVGAEALIRWQHPTRGVVSPNDFIPVAEETGMILPIGKWVMREACTQARKWQIDFPNTPPLRISVNLSVKQLEEPGLAEEIADVLRETQLQAENLELEITESVIMKNVQANIEQLEAIKKLGVRLAIDDFGTGYSSLSYLEHFPLDTLKIDRAFVGQIGLHSANGNGSNGNGSHSNGNGSNGNGSHGNGNGNAYNGNGTGNSDGMAILRAVSTLGQTLGVSVTAEGIETSEQRTQLHALECEIGQGYHFAEPLEPAALDALLLSNSNY